MTASRVLTRAVAPRTTHQLASGPRDESALDRTADVSRTSRPSMSNPAIPHMRSRPRRSSRGFGGMDSSQPSWAGRDSSESRPGRLAGSTRGPQSARPVLPAPALLGRRRVIQLEPAHRVDPRETRRDPECSGQAGRLLLAGNDVPPAARDVLGVPAELLDEEL